MLDLISPSLGIAASAIIAARTARGSSTLIAAILGAISGAATAFVAWFLMMAWVLRQ